MAMNQSCYGLRGKSATRGYYAYFATKELVANLQQQAHGSVFDTITRDTLAGVSIVVPPTDMVKAYESEVGPTMERLRTGLFCSQTFAALRDTLLPKLVSGELRVEKAKRILGESR
jgi:type I restriction enzyme S subunit